MQYLDLQFSRNFEKLFKDDPSKYMPSSTSAQPAIRFFYAFRFTCDFLWGKGGFERPCHWDGANEKRGLGEPEESSEDLASDNNIYSLKLNKDQPANRE